MVSLREQSSSTLQAAIRSQGGDDGEILKRANICLANYYDPDLDPETKAGMRESFVRALRDLPLWAVLRGFDGWEKTMQRRPAPGEIVILASRELKPIVDELGRRQREHETREAARLETEASRVTAAQAAEILARAGFTPNRIDAVRRAPMASTFDEAEARRDEPPAPHWSDVADPDGPEMRALRAARDANTLVQASRARLDRRREPDDSAPHDFAAE